MGTTLIPPSVTARTDQAMAALAQANRIRLRRASLTRWIYGQPTAQSHAKAADLILQPDPVLHSMRVLDLLQRVRQVGPAQAEQLLQCADIAPTRTVGALTPRQRAVLAALLRLRADQLAPRARPKTAR